MKIKISLFLLNHIKIIGLVMGKSQYLKLPPSLYFGTKIGIWVSFSYLPRNSNIGNGERDLKYAYMAFTNIISTPLLQEQTLVFLVQQGISRILNNACVC